MQAGAWIMQLKGMLFRTPAAERRPEGGWGKAVAMVMTTVLAGAMAADGALAASRGGSGGGGRSGGQHAGKSHSRHHHNHNGSAIAAGVFVGAPWWPWWDYPIYYPAAASVTAPVSYIERSEQEGQAAGDWLYCAKARGYFPYVAECAEGWERVPAAPLQ